MDNIKISKEVKIRLDEANSDLKKLEQEIAPFIIKKKENIKEIKEENWQKSSVYLVNKSR